MRNGVLLGIVTTGIVAAACNGGHGGNGTPSPTPSPSPTPGPIGVTVFDQIGSTMTDAQVVFAAADGSILGEANTDSSGHAAFAAFPDGGMVSAGYLDSGSGMRRLETVLGVKPGDQLRFHDGPPVSNASLGTFTVDLPTYATATSYQVDSVCGAFSAGGSPSAMVEIFANCGSTGPVDLIARAFDGTGNLLASISVASVSWTPGGVVDLTASTWGTTFTTLDASIAGAPASSTNAYVRASVRHAGTDLAPLTKNSALNGGSASFTLSLPPFTGSTVTWDAITYGGVSDFEILDVGGAGGTVALTGSDFFADPALDPVDTTDPDRPRYTWNGAGVQTTVLTVFATSSGSGEHLWWSVTTAGATAKFPALPASLAAWRASLFDIAGAQELRYYRSTTIDAPTMRQHPATIDALLRQTPGRHTLAYPD